MKAFFEKVKSNLKFLFLPVLIITSLFSCEDDPQLPAPDFSFNNNVLAPAEITFENTSQFSEKYVWYFGDGAASAAESPTHMFYWPGNYTVTLKAINGEGSSSITKTVRVTGITCIIYNASSIDLPNAFICYDNGVELTDFIDLGNIPSGMYSVPCYTDKESMIAGFHDPNENAIYLTQPQHLYQNSENIIEINDFTSLHKIVLE